MLNGQTTRFVAVTDAGSSYECVRDHRGIHRYSARDFGRVTGTGTKGPDPRNVSKDASPVPLKQWNHWCKKAGLKPTAKHNGLAYYMEGHGHVWRLNDKGMLQCGDTLEEFDRWALCTITQTFMPLSEAEFLKAVKDLLEEWNQIKNGATF